ncbi:50S ribosomal protein L11 methyltransferase [Candidatus Lucifugimonas marina]|uniref:Ribosomal protein L11 methyltransferase n=1 Tax=Candidatus Lucifugimonas marina TaxID=3038979 RepID=A0AAJ5ZFU6_9CHLR|nr:methyltransferase domain-containing protein [SAR202 cluster bacterium JH702]MDG0870136.1 methyltransferase domain-containing protein [SAR202 cluster bacterium JH639]WFG36307.1 methyltransferase domain-containing protein [SAR202 cluster bacterium JH545]WFG40240.1 methyltransferase domain-containing protein [SAR202 cluster bacterium JH1073]
MRWLQLSIKAPPEYVEPLTHLFNIHGEGSASVEQPGGYNPDEGEKPDPSACVTIRGWLPIDPTTESRKTAIDVGVRLIRHLIELPEIEEVEVTDDEWRNQKFDPIKVGENLVIVPRSTKYESKPSDIVIELEPGLAFGTGHHPTTLMCLEEIEKAVKPGDRFLDVGCGSGVLSIAALALGAEHATGLDIEDDAVKSSIENLEEAGFTEQSTILAGSIPHDQVPEGGFDVVGANIAANVLIMLAEPLIASVAEGGVIITSGVLETRLDEVVEAFKAVGGAVESSRKIEDWTATRITRVTGSN